MRPIRRPPTAMENPSPHRSALSPILLAKPITLRIALAHATLRLEHQMLYRRVEIDRMRQTSNLAIRASNLQMVRHDEQTIAIGSVEVRAHVEIRVVGQVPYCPVEDQLSTIERFARCVESLHIRFQRLQAWELVVGAALLEIFPIPRDVHSGRFGEGFGGFVCEDGTVGFPEIHCSLGV